VNPASKAKAILMALSDAPATASELAAELEMKRCYVGPTLIAMWRKGYATRSIFTRGPSGPAPFMYQISELGLLKLSAREVTP